MKKVLFILPNYSIGGINTSLLNLLSFLKKKDIDLRIFVCNPTGVLKDNYLNFKILPSNRLYSILQPFSKDSKLHWDIVKYFIRATLKVLRFANIDLIPLIYKRAAIQLSKDNYDVVVALQEGPVTHFTSFFKAGILVAWIHSMYERYYEETGFKKETYIYGKFNKIISVSEAACKSFLNLYPQFTDKTICIYNCIDNSAVRLMAKDVSIISDDFKTDVFTIISVGRIDPVKQFSKIPEIARKLIDAGCKFRWYILGGIADNKENQLLISNIRELGLEDKVILLGNSTNPYAYLSKSDLLVCTSKSESFNYSLNEAKVLHIPVVTTDFECAKEFVENEYDGVVTPIEDMDLKISELILDTQKYDRMKKNIQEFEYLNESMIDKFIDVTNGL